MAIISKITDELKAHHKGKLDFYMLRRILSVVRSWPQRRKTPFWPRELEAQGVLGFISKTTPKIKGKVLEAWVKEGFGKRARWQDTFIGLGMNYWGKNGEIPPILLDYQIHWHTPNPELELLLQKIETKYGKTEAQEIQTTGIVDLKDIYEYRKKLWFWICDIEGLRVLAPFLVVIVGKEIDFTIKLMEIAGFIKEPLQVCFTGANIKIPGKKTYYSHGVKFTCPIQIDPKSTKCLPIEKKLGPYHEWVLTNVDKCGSLVYEMANTYKEARDAVAANRPYIYMTGVAIGQYDSWRPISPWHSYNIYRAPFQFRTDQAYLPPGAPIQYAAIRVKRYATVYPLVLDFNVIVQDGQPEFPHDPIELTDYYRKWYLGNYGQILASELPIGEFADIPLNSRGLDRLNLGGYTKFMLRSSRDIEDIPPWSSENEERIMLYINNGYEYDPRLVIRITLTMPKVITGPATYITKNRVRMEVVISDSGYWYSLYGIQFKEGINGVILDFHIGFDDYRTKVYYQWLYSLKSGTEYYFRGFIENGKGRSEGNWVKFKTLEE